jgi:hypothetical protein
MFNDFEDDNLSKADFMKSFIEIKTDYMREINSMTDAPMMDWDACDRIYSELGSRRSEGNSIMDYRDSQFRSLFTGNVAPEPLVKWKDETCRDISQWVARYKL